MPQPVWTSWELQAVAKLWQNDFLTFTKSWVWPQHCRKLGVVDGVCNPSTREVEVGGPDIKGILSIIGN